MIDSHVHFWHYDAAEYDWIDDTMSALKRDYLPQDAKREMDTVGVTACVAVQARQTPEETRWLLDLAARHPFIMGVVGWIDLRAGDVMRQLSAFTGRPALVGIRHIVQAEPDGFLALPAFRAGVAGLERTGLVYEILVYARQLPDAVAFARALPRQRFVLDHLGKPDIRAGGFDRWRRHLDELAALPNVVFTDAIGSSETGFTGISFVSAGAKTTGGPRVTPGPSTIVIGEDGRRVGPGEIGRIARGGHMPLGYYKDPVKTAAMFVEVDGERYVVPGDFARVEEDGTVTLLGRGNVCVNTGGEKVFPEEVEGAIKEHPDVFDTLVIGIPDERLGQRVAAIVQPREGVSLDQDDLEAVVRKHIAGYKVPRSIWLVDHVGRTPAGKADYRWAHRYADEHPAAAGQREDAGAVKGQPASA